MSKSKRKSFNVARVTKRVFTAHRPIVGVDGSSLDGASLGACAATSSSGASLVGWFRRGDRQFTPNYAELQAVRLGLRLAQEEGAHAVLTDSGALCHALATSTMGGSYEGLERLCGILDGRAFREVLSKPRSIELRLTEHPKPRKGATSGDRMLRAPHTLAWITRRMLMDNLDPREEMGYLIHWARRAGTTSQSNLPRYYADWLKHHDIAGCE